MCVYYYYLVVQPINTQCEIHYIAQFTPIHTTPYCYKLACPGNTVYASQCIHQPIHTDACTHRYTQYTHYKHTMLNTHYSCVCVLYYTTHRHKQHDITCSHFTYVHYRKTQAHHSTYTHTHSTYYTHTNTDAHTETQTHTLYSKILSTHLNVTGINVITSWRL